MAAEKPTPPFDTFVFDVDGTLLDTLDDLVVLTNDALAEFNLPPRTREEINSYVGNGVKALMYQAVPEGTPQDVADACLARWKENYGTYPNDLTKPYPGIPALLAELRRRGCKLGVLSNKFDAGVQEVVGVYLPGLFAVAHGESADIPRKPDPTGLLRTIEELGSVPERTVYVGDVAVARNAGTYAVGVTWGYHEAERLRAAAADLVIDDPRALLDLLG